MHATHATHAKHAKHAKHATRSAAYTIVTEKDLVARCGGTAFLKRDPCGPAATFFWAAAAIQAPDPSCRRLGLTEGDACTWSASIRPRLPAVNAFEISDDLMVITVRGTVSLEDAKVDLTVMRTRASFEKKAMKAVAESTTPSVRHMIETDLVESRKMRLAFHHGFYVLAAKTLGPVLEAIEARKPKRVVFYGHSLGGAVASFLYRWVRMQMQLQMQAVDVRLAVMSCPAICDAACYRAWFEPLGDDGDRARHYYSAGDVVVRRLPGFASLDCHATRSGEYEGEPWSVGTTRSTASVRSRLQQKVSSTLLSHLTLVPGTLRKVVDDTSAILPRGLPRGTVFSFSNGKASSFARRLVA